LNTIYYSFIDSAKAQDWTLPNTNEVMVT